MEVKQCPNCGAPITGWDCPYCGTSFLVSMGDIKGPVNVCFERDGRKYAMSLVIESVEFENNFETLFSDNRVYQQFKTSTVINIRAIMTDDIKNRVDGTFL